MYGNDELSYDILIEMIFYVLMMHRMNLMLEDDLCWSYNYYYYNYYSY